MFFWRVSLSAALCALTWAPPVHACKCSPAPSVDAARRGAAAVFEGQVAHVTPVGTGDLVVALNVVRAWKNADSEQLLLRTRADAAACGVHFEVGETYLVYARAAEKDAELPGLEVSRCDRTRPIAEAVDDLEELGMGVAPVSATTKDLAEDHDPASAVDTQQKKPAAGGCASCALGGEAHPGVLELAGGIALVLWLRRHRPRRHRRPSA